MLNDRQTLDGSPVTNVVTLSCPDPSRFFASHTKVVFMLSSTFSTESLFPLIWAVFGIWPDALIGRGKVNRGSQS